MGVPRKAGERSGAFPLKVVQSVLVRRPVVELVAVGIPESRAHGTVPDVSVPMVVIFALPGHVERAVFSTFPRPTVVLSSVCHVLSHR